MKHFWTIFSHEIRMLLVSPGTYVAAVFFLATMGFMFTGILEAYSHAPQDASPAIMFFKYFWFPVIFMVPLLTMRCLAEERRLGTIETLLTTPVTTPEVVLGKYGAAYGLYLALWGATGGFFLILKNFAGNSSRLLDPGPLAGGYVFVAVSGLLFIAIGVLASALARNQAVAGFLCFFMLSGLIWGDNFLARDATLLNREALKMRDMLRTDARALAKRALIDPARLASFKSYVGYQNVAFELIDYATLLRDCWPQIEGRTAVRKEEVEKARRLAEELVRAAGERKQGTLAVAQASSIRLRAMTLLLRSYDETRRAIGFLRRHQGDVDRIAPSLFAGRGGRGKAGKAAGDAAGCPT